MTVYSLFDFHRVLRAEKRGWQPYLFAAVLLAVFNAQAGDVTSENNLAMADYSQPWQVMVYSKDPALSQQRFFDIAFTANGTAWIAADDGLHKFDGYDWSLWRTNDGLPSSFVRAVCVDAQDRLWVGSDAGVGIWDGNRRKYYPQGAGTGLANENVRSIDLDPDGTLWFSCDQWPQPMAQPGGLSSYNGRWQTFRQTNGLPSDYVLGYFRDSTGRQFALTPRGWCLREGDKWGPPPGTGYDKEETVLQMAEARDGTLFAQGEHTLLTFNDGRWQSHPGSHTRLLCTTRSGELAAVEYNATRGQLWFSLWDGAKFVRASAAVACRAGTRFYHLREAPDGSLWCVGIGTAVRWAFHSNKWTFYPQLPAPVFADQHGRVWFADESNVVVREWGQFKPLVAGALQVWPGTNQMMIWDRDREDLFVTDPEDPSRRNIIKCGLQSVDLAVAGKNGGWWILGQGQGGNGLVARYQNGEAKVVPTPELAHRTLAAGHEVPPSDLVVIARDGRRNSYDLAKITDDHLVWLPMKPAPPAVMYPQLAEGAGRFWLTSYSGIYEQSLTSPDRWVPVTAISAGGFGWSLGTPNEALFVFSGGRVGHPGCALFSSNRWLRADGDFVHPSYGVGNETIYLPSRNGVFIRRQPGTLDFEYLQAPADVLVNVAVADVEGNIWLGTSDGTLCYQPNRVPPKALASVPALEIARTAPLPISLRGQERFEVTDNPLGYRYSWRLDRNGWTQFGPWPGQTLHLPDAPPGDHLLAVRVRNVDGNVSAVPAYIRFTVLPDPLQKQPWFLALVTLGALALAWLLWLRMLHVRQLAVTNSTLRDEIAVRRRTEVELVKARAELELRVTHRTEQLTRANEQLKLHIVERQKAEQQSRALEEQLHQAQKMEAIGTLAGGIAHDFNNILAIIIPYCDIVMEEIYYRPDLQDHLREVLKAANRAKDLVQQILTFSHRQHRQQRHICDVQPAVKEALKLLRSAVPSSIEMRQNILPTHPVLADPTQIHQVVMNLCVNAQHAMEGRQGVLDVTWDECEVDDGLCKRNPDLRPGKYVRLTVRDNGCGIPQENLKRIFEPFFTTREVGQGTGLGLAVVHGIVRDHDGAILVESEVGRGTEFQVLLPARAKTADEIGVALEPSPQAHGEHILIVDDEEALGTVLQRLLTKAGYHVTVHTHPQAALEDFLARPTDIHLVLSDLTMPGMNGLELAEKIQEIRPELPLVITTGFGGGLIEPEQLERHRNVCRVLEKPLQSEAVLRAIAEILEGQK